jgi:hypothetical protein
METFGRLFEIVLYRPLEGKKKGYCLMLSASNLLPPLVSFHDPIRTTHTHPVILGCSAYERSKPERHIIKDRRLVELSK